MNKLSYRRKARLLEKLAGAARLYRIAKAQSKKGTLGPPSIQPTPLEAAGLRAGEKWERRVERWTAKNRPEALGKPGELGPYMERAGAPTTPPPPGLSPAEMRDHMLGVTRQMARGGGPAK